MFEQNKDDTAPSESGAIQDSSPATDPVMDIDSAIEERLFVREQNGGDSNRDPEESATPDSGQAAGEMQPPPVSEDGDAPAEGEAGKANQQENATVPAGSVGDEPPPQGENDPDDENAVQEGKFTPEQQKIFNRAIGKVRARLREQVEKLTQSQRELEQYQQARSGYDAEIQALKAAKTIPVGVGINPLIGIESERELNDYVSAQYELKRRLARGADDEGNVKIMTPDGREFTLTREQADAEIDRIDRLIALDAPRHKEFLAKKAQADSWLKDNVPDAIRPGGELTREMDAFVASFPAVKQLPDYRRMAYYYALGQQVSKRYKQDAVRLAYTGKMPETAARIPMLKPVVKQKEPPLPITKHGAPHAQIGRQPPKPVDGPINRDQAADAIESRLFA